MFGVEASHWVDVWYDGVQPLRWWYSSTKFGCRIHLSFFSLDFQMSCTMVQPRQFISSIWEYT